MTILLFTMLCFMVCWICDFNLFTETSNIIDRRNHKNINHIKKRFKKLLKSAKNRNIDDVREDLLDTLVDYKQVKTEEFINAKNLLDKSSQEINRTINNITLQKASCDKEISQLRTQYEMDKSEITLQKGILKASAIDKYNKTLESLAESQKMVKEKLEKLNGEIDLFSSKYELKRAEISLMLVSNLVDLNFSTIDLSLDDLVVEYQDRQNELKNAREINAKINNVSEQEETVEDKEKYKEMFLNY